MTTRPPTSDTMLALTTAALCFVIMAFTTVLVREFPQYGFVILTAAVVGMISIALFVVWHVVRRGLERIELDNGEQV